jgi:hypothetical protein
MAFTVTDISGARNSASGANSPATTTSTSLAGHENKLLILYGQVNGDNAGFDSITGDTFSDGGGSWINIGTSAVGSHGDYMDVWARTIGSSAPGSGVITASYTGTFRRWAVGLIVVTGHSTSSFAGVSATDNPAKPAGSPLSPTLSGATANSLTMAFYIANSVSAAWTVTGGYTELMADYNTVDTFYGTVHYDENDSSPSATKSAGTRALAFAWEILPSDSGSPVGIEVIRTIAGVTH